MRRCSKSYAKPQPLRRRDRVTGCVTWIAHDQACRYQCYFLHGSVSDKWHVAERCGILGIDPKGKPQPSRRRFPIGNAARAAMIPSATFDRLADEAVRITPQHFGELSLLRRHATLAAAAIRIEEA